MNGYALIILAALIIDYSLDVIADALNLRALREELPAGFEGVYDAEKYRRSQEYTRVNTRFGFVTGTFDLAVMLVFWFAGGFSYLDEIVRGWNLHLIWTGLLYIGILMLVKTALSLPFSVYATFVIEERFGFNKTTPATFVKDLVKGLLLAAAIGGPLLAGVMAFFQYAGSFAWLYSWCAVTLFMLVMTYVAPTWIMPLFNKFTPIEEGELKEKILAYAKSVAFSLKGIFVMDGSRRSTKSNAFFTGFGRNKRIALFDTLIEKHTVPELVAVLAHEIGHYKKRHIVKGLIIGIAHTGIVFFLLSVFLTHAGLFRAFYIDQPSVYTGLIFFGMLYAPIEMLLSLFMHIISRKNEFAADRFAADTTGTPDAMIDSLKKLSTHNLSNLTPHPFHVFLHYSHPPVLQRIEALKKG